MTHISKKNKGQYFTTSVLLKETIYILILNNPSIILEPSVGQGHLVEYIKAKKPNINFDLYEIDERPNQKTDRDGGFGSTGVS